MKSTRFATVVENYGEPEPYLVLTDPAKDRTLQTAIKQTRVMTVFQPNVGSTADRGTVGFEPGTGRQFLIFPKSLRALSGNKIVGIKYELLKAKPVAKSERAAAPRRPSKAKPKARKHHSKPTTPHNVVPFKGWVDEDEEDADIADLKKKVRRAMDVLEEGRPVAAFNLLKRIVES